LILKPESNGQMLRKAIMLTAVVVNKDLVKIPIAAVDTIATVENDGLHHKFNKCFL